MRALIFGCGYLGSKVATIWQSLDYHVSVVTRNKKNAERFRSLGYQPLIADITDLESLKNIPTDFDVVLFSVGFDRTRYADIRHVYVDGLKNVLERLKTAQSHWVYISSTGVFGDCKGQWIDESTPAQPLRPGGQACLEAEQLVRASQNPFTILRLAGIYGPGRIPRLQAIKDRAWSELGQSRRINLIHVADAAAIVAAVVEQKVLDQTFLVSDGQPADRKLFYEFVADQAGTGPINWNVDSEVEGSRRSAADKKVSNSKLVEQTGYQFQFPDFRAGIIDSISKD